MRLSRFLFGEQATEQRSADGGSSEFCLNQVHCAKVNSGHLEDEKIRIVVFQQDADQRHDPITLFDSKKVHRRDCGSPQPGKNPGKAKSTDAVDIGLNQSASSGNAEESRRHSLTGTFTPQQGSSQVFSLQKTPCYSSSPQWQTASGKSQPMMTSSLGSGRSTPLVTSVTRTTGRNTWSEVGTEDVLLSFGGQVKNAAKMPREQVSVDAKMLAEMVFGSLPMKLNNSGVKIHQLKTPHGIMFTYMFNLHIRKTGNRSVFSGLEDSYCVSSPPSSSLSSLNSYESPLSFATSSGSFAFDMSGSERSSSHIDRLTQSCSEGRPYRPSPSPHGSSNTSSIGYSSLRTTRTKPWRGSWEIIRSSGSLALTESIGSQDDELMLHVRAPRCAISVLFMLPQDDRTIEEFLYTHWALLVRHMLRLRHGIDCAIAGRQYLRNSTAFQNAEREFRTKLLCLWASPRIEDPVWLTLTSQHKRSTTCSTFAHMLISSIKEHSAMGRKRFLASLITAVLTHHVGWVPTVYDEDLEVLLNHTSKKHDWGSGTLFNALGLQLSDAHGALCWPLHLARTIVIGEQADVVARLLFLLTFFIRCPDIIDNSHRLISTCKERVVEAFGSTEVETHRSLSPPVLAEIQDRLVAVKDGTPPLERKFGDARTAPFSPGVIVGNFSRYRSTLSYCSPGSSSTASASISPVVPGERSPPRDRVLLGRTRVDRPAQTLAETTASSGTTISIEQSWPVTPATASTSHKDEPKSGSPSKSLLSSSLEKYDEEHAMAVRKESEKQVEDFMRLLTGLTEISSMDNEANPSLRLGNLSYSMSGLQDINSVPLHQNLGRSLFGGLCREYQSDFVLHGTCQKKSEVVRQANEDLHLAVNYSIVNSLVDSAVCIVVDTDKWTCEVLSQSRPAPNIDKSALPTDGMLLEEKKPAEEAKIVQSLLTAVGGAWDLGMPEEMCLIHLEDGLRQILLKSQMVAEYLSRPTAKMDARQLQSLFGVESSDMNLLLKVARVFWPRMTARSPEYAGN